MFSYFNNIFSIFYTSKYIIDIVVVIYFLGVSLIELTNLLLLH
jgi:hypothetical protein